MNKRPAKVHYLDMGPWPPAVGLCFEEQAYLSEMKRLRIKDADPWIGQGCAATFHSFASDSGRHVYIIALGPSRERSKEQTAALVAHEAVHLIQRMNRHYGSLGEEAEAYLVQMIVQEALQQIWKSNRIRSRIPKP